MRIEYRVRAIDAAGPRKLIAVSLRGRAASDCPDSGWTPQHHQSDIAAVKQVKEEWASMVESIEPSLTFDPRMPRHQVLWIEHGHITFTNAEAIAAAVAFQQSSD